MNTLVAGILVALIIAIAGFGCGHRVGKNNAEQKAALDMAEHMAADEDAQAAAAAKSAAASADVATAVNTAAQAAYKRGMEDAEAKRTDVIADLRSGKQRLRDEWSCKAASAGNVPGTPSPAAESFSATADREEGAGDLVRAAAQCDAQVAGVIEAYNAAKNRIDEYNKQGVGSSRR
jgi:hypothetical protein